MKIFSNYGSKPIGFFKSFKNSFQLLENVYIKKEYF